MHRLFAHLIIDLYAIIMPKFPPRHPEFDLLGYIFSVFIITHFILPRNGSYPHHTRNLLTEHIAGASP
jgi:hypothetical protein